MMEMDAWLRNVRARCPAVDAAFLLEMDEHAPGSTCAMDRDLPRDARMRAYAGLTLATQHSVPYLRRALVLIMMWTTTPGRREFWAEWIPEEERWVISDEHTRWEAYLRTIRGEG